MNELGVRLKEERVRLGFSQSEFGELCGIKLNAQANYEKDKRQPGANYLVAADAIGVDVFYVLRGVRKTREKLARNDRVRNNVLSEIDSAELRVMITRIVTALNKVKLDAEDDILVDKMLPVYMKLSAEQSYNSRDAIGKSHFDDMLKLFAMQLT
ncbi:MAG: helix-turn-helix transcriptional regulator [Pseudomonas sp.]|nr:helix-turn-helix transcriptional regulator [Pseudomonas sp.]